jgi:hypothetical protein
MMGASWADLVELALLRLAEATATAKHIDNDTQGVKGLERDIREVAKTSETIRQLTEQGLGRPVVNPNNALSYTKRKPISQLSLFDEPDNTQEGVF